MAAYSANSLKRKTEFVSGYKVADIAACGREEILNIYLEKQSNALYT
jgi:hypothetical protein